MKEINLIWIIPINLLIGILIGVALMDVDIDLSMDNNTLEASKNLINFTNDLDKISDVNDVDIDKLKYIKYLEKDLDKLENRLNSGWNQFEICHENKNEDTWLCTNNKKYVEPIKKAKTISAELDPNKLFKDEIIAIGKTKAKEKVLEI